jgi:hypothetical protein
VEAAAIIAVVVLLALMTQRWFWALLFLVGGLAAGFTMLACIFHFMILEAVGLFFIAVICICICAAVLDT